MARYSASIIGGQNLIFRPYIEVRSDTVKFKIPGFFSGDVQTMMINSITDIRISGTLISKTIEIYTSGMGVIRAEGFSRSDAKAIERDINNNRNQPAVPVVKPRRSRMREQDEWDEQEEPNEPVDFLIHTKNDFTDLDALQETFQTTVNTDEIHLLRWLTKFEKTGHDLTLFLFEELDLERPEECDYFIVNDLKIECSDFLFISKFKCLFQDHYWDMLKKYAPFNTEETPTLINENSTSLTYHLKKAGITF